MSDPVFRACVQCGWRFVPHRREQTCCSRSCAARRGAVAWATKYPQAGEHNFNFRGWSSTRPAVYTQRFKALHPEKAQAHRLVSAAIRRGALVRPAACAACGVSCKPDAHHTDYRHPLTVTWLCRRCHLASDRERRVS